MVFFKIAKPATNVSRLRQDRLSRWENNHGERVSAAHGTDSGDGFRNRAGVFRAPGFLNKGLTLAECRLSLTNKNYG